MGSTFINSSLICNAEVILILYEIFAMECFGNLT